MVLVGYALHPLVTLYELRDYEPVDPQEFIEKMNREAAARNPSPHDAELIERCGEGKYTLTHTADEELKACFQDYLKDYFKPFAAFQARVVKLIHAGECEDAFTLLEESPNRQNWQPSIEAELAYHGLCRPQDKAAARLFWEANTQTPYPISVELAYLAEIYWHGVGGVERDEDRAKHYARLAAIATLWDHDASPLQSFYAGKRPFGLYDDIWGLNQTEMRESFASYLTGPRTLIPPLARQQFWLRSMAEDDGKATLEAATVLKNEWNMPSAAVSLMKNAAVLKNYAPAYYRLYKWMLSENLKPYFTRYYENFYPEKSPTTRRHHLLCDAYRNLVTAAENGHSSALSDVYTLFNSFAPKTPEQRELWAEGFGRMTAFAQSQTISFRPHTDPGVKAVHDRQLNYIHTTPNTKGWLAYEIQRLPIIPTPDSLISRI